MNIETLNALATFAECIYEPDDIVEVRRLPSKRSSWHAAEDLANIADGLTADNRQKQNIFVGGNPRKQMGGTEKEDVALARCLWVDWDGGCTEAEARAKIVEAELPAPTILNFSGGGIHAWWRLTEPITDLAEFTRLQKRIIAATGADGSIHDPPRIMRLPGFLNQKPKYNPPPVCRILEADPSRRWTLQEMVGHLPEVKEEKPVPSDTNNCSPAGLSEYARAAAYVAKIPGKGEGERNKAAFHVAALLVKDFNLAIGEARQLLAMWNQGNNPPLPDDELADVLQHAAQYGDHTPGQKLNEKPRNGTAYQSHDANGQARGTAEEGEKHRTKHTRPKTMSEIIKTFTELRAAVMECLLRIGETMNIVAPTKRGKSWLVIGLVLCIVTGRRWLGMFKCVPGKVLILDNELHPETTANRIPKVAAAMGIEPEEYAENLLVENLRGRDMDIIKLEAYLDQFEPGEFIAIVLDAGYRFLPEGWEENSNPHMTRFYNAIDRYAARLQCAFIVISHSSKGNQADKSVTDIGAGAGSQSRTTDTHVALRQHQEPDAVVLDMMARSWPPLEKPIVLRWNWPVWFVDHQLDPEDLQRPGRRGRKDEPEKVTWTADKFAATFGKPEPKLLAAFHAAAAAEGIADRKATSLVNQAAATGKLFKWPTEDRRVFAYATVAPPAAPPPEPAAEPKSKGKRKPKKDAK